jgi:hypothetical protein
MAKLFHDGIVITDDWSPLDGVPAPEYVPEHWNGPHVGVRYADAWRTLNKLPLGTFRPREFGTLWPAYRDEDLPIGEWVEAYQSGELRALYEDRNRVRERISAIEISHMDIALAWPTRYLPNDLTAVFAMNICGQAAAIGIELGDLLKRIRKRRGRLYENEIQRANWQACDKIADGLIIDRLGVF